MNPPPVIKEHEGILVVRDDLLPGGTKVRALPVLFTPDQQHYVYASPVQGYAQIALAIAAKQHGKTANIFCAKRKDWHPRTREAEKHGATIFEVPAGYLNVVKKAARDACQRFGYRLLPFGLDDPAFISALAAVASDLPVRPEEVWTVAGSGVLSRALQLAWPWATFHAVAVGQEPDVAFAKIYRSERKFEQAAKTFPPFPSCDNYDAKAWEFIKKHAKPGALFWNVAA